MLCAKALPAAAQTKAEQTAKRVTICMIPTFTRGEVIDARPLGLLTRGSLPSAGAFPVVLDPWRSAAPRLQWRDRPGFSPGSRRRLADVGVHQQERAPLSRTLVCAVKRLMVLAIALIAALGSTQAHGAFATAPATMRIVSLVPSLTEDLFALGAGNAIVGVSEFSNSPAAARSLPRVASSSSVDAERIVALHPNLVVGIPAQAAAVASLRRANLRVVLLPDDTIADIYATLERLGELVGRAQRAAQLTRRMHLETDALVRTVPPGRGPSVFVVLDVKPIYTVGNRSYIASLIAMAGGHNVAKIDAAYGRYSAEALLAAQPDVIVVDPMVGFHSVEREEPWRSLRAVRNKRVAQIPDPDTLLEPGPRYIEGLRWLIAVLHNRPQD